MNRKERLKLTRTPEKGFIYGDDSLYLPTPTPKKYIEKEEEDVLPFKVVNNKKTWKTTLKIYVIYFHLILPYVLMFLIYFYSDKKSSTDTKRKIRETEVNKTNNVSKMYNLARIELGTSVSVEDGMYFHGLYGFRTHNDPNIILNDNLSPGDCLAIQNDTGIIRIDFKCKFTISRIGIFHPDTDNRESAVKDFEIIGSDDTILGRFVYDLTKSRYQYFDFTPTNTNCIRIKILSNNGCKKYTTLYKVFIYGKLNKKLN